MSSGTSLERDRFALAGDGSKEDVYGCLRGLFASLHLTEQETGLALMITYGLLKAEDVETLPTTWRLQLMAALRFALLHGLQGQAVTARAVSTLQTNVELWRPGWREDYDAFVSRGPVAGLLEAAVARAKLLRHTDLYRDEAWREPSPPPIDDCEEIASI